MSQFQKIVIILAISLILFSACKKAEVVRSNTFDGIKAQCSSLNGKWVDQYQECEGISEADCITLGGSFNGCASACRHIPDAEGCTMNCVIVCSFSS